MSDGSQIDYEALAQEAMRGIVRTVLQRVATTGLPGEHHFYIAFDTNAQGVSVSKRLKERYPAEMTIVLQNQFWQLVVNEDRFEVTLSFDNVPERLVVPLRSIRVFFDPSVPYGVQFEGSDLAGDAADDLEPRGAEAPGRRSGLTRHPGGSTAAEASSAAGGIEKVSAHRKLRASKAEAASEPSMTVATTGPGGGPPRRQGARPKLVKSKPDPLANNSNVVEIDKFRKS